MFSRVSGNISKIFISSTFRQSTVTLSATILNALFSGLFYIFLARFLGPEKFGLVSISLTLLVMFSDLGDLGLNTGIVNFVPKNLKDKELTSKYFKLAFEIKLVVWLIISIFSLLASGLIARYIFLKPELTIPISLALIGVGSILIFSYTTAVFQALQNFWKWGTVQVSSSFLRLISLFILFYFSLLTVNISIIIYYFAPFIVSVFALSKIVKIYLNVKNEKSVFKDFFKFNKWVVLFTILATIGARLDTFLSARFLTFYELGLYSAATQLVKVVPQIITAIGTVMAPKMSSMGKISDFVSYLKKSLVMVLTMSLLGVVCIPIVVYIIPIIFGSEYLPSVSIFIILFFAMLVFLISTPIHLGILYYFSNAKFFFWLSILNIILIFTFGITLLPKFGGQGAAFSVLLAQIFGLIIPLVWIIRSIKNRIKETSINY